MFWGIVIDLQHNCVSLFQALSDKGFIDQLLLHCWLIVRWLDTSNLVPELTVTGNNQWVINYYNRLCGEVMWHWYYDLIRCCCLWCTNKFLCCTETRDRPKFIFMSPLMVVDGCSHFYFRPKIYFLLLFFRLTLRQSRPNKAHLKCSSLHPIDRPQKVPSVSMKFACR